MTHTRLEEVHEIIRRELPYSVKNEVGTNKLARIFLSKNYGSRMFDHEYPFILLNKDAVWDSFRENGEGFLAFRTPELAMEIRLMFF